MRESEVGRAGSDVRRYISRLLPGILLILSACGDRGADTQEFAVPPEMPDDPTVLTAAEAERVADREELPEASQLLAVDESGVTGRLTVTADPDSVVLLVEVEGLPGEGEYAAHVHRGVCAEGGPVAAPLSPVVGLDGGSGASSTTMAAGTLPANEPLFVQVHGANGAPVACGDIVESGP
jgi:hypothetical protein